MTLKDRLAVLIKLGEHLNGTDEFLEAVMIQTQYNNAWFTIENQRKAISAIANEMLNEAKLSIWANSYPIKDVAAPKTIGMVLAGNIPLVGFNDVLCTFVAGHKSLIKLSEKDKFLLPYLIKLLTKLDERCADYFEITPILKDFDGVIATGSNNSARYFDAYFSKYPHIIRRNRNAIAVLSGKETAADFLGLGHDIFQYFGMGCRNVSKLFVPKDYDFNELLEVLHDNFKELVLNSKYKNNFDYNFAVLTLNSIPFYNNGCLMLLESEAIPSKIASLHFEYYESIDTLNTKLIAQKEQIQCVATQLRLKDLPHVALGHAQKPTLYDYADGVDTMEFLTGL